MSVFISVISTFDTNVWRNNHLSIISRMTSSPPEALTASNPDPTPNQPGTIWRDCVQPNTHGIARRSSRPVPPPGRRDGREPMFIWPSSSTGVEERK